MRTCILPGTVLQFHVQHRKKGELWYKTSLRLGLLSDNELRTTAESFLFARNHLVGFISFASNVPGHDKGDQVKTQA